MRYRVAMIAFPVLAVFLLLSSYVMADGDQQDDIRLGRALGMSCTACHGMRGISPGSIPSIYGKSGKFILDELEAFKAGKRESTVMERLAKGYSDEEIRLIAEYYASLAEKSK